MDDEIKLAAGFANSAWNAGKGHTVAFVKRMATKMARELDVAHHVALDKAAQTCGYQNYKHFLNATKQRDTNPPTIESDDT